MIVINYKDPRPIYEQIKDGFKKLILSGILEAGEKMPSVRDLSGDLSINPNTIQRAYKDLESEGFIESVPGKGSFVAESSGLNEKHIDELKVKMTAYVKEMHDAGISKDSLLRIIEQIYK